MTGRVVLVLALAGAGVAGAHDRSVSYSTVRLAPGGARVEVRIARLDVSRLPPRLQEARALAPWAVAHLRLEAAGDACVVHAAPEWRRATAGWVVVAWRVACPAGAPTALTSTLLLDVLPTHLHMTRIVRPDGTSTEHALVESAPRAEWRDADAGPGSVVQWVGLGVAHVASGWDHLAFVLGLVLLARALGEVAILVSAFTIAHATTLAAAGLGFVRPEVDAVEALIGFSIALVGLENGWLVGGRGRVVPLGATAALGTLALGAAVIGAGRVPARALAGLALFTGCHFALLARARRASGLRALIALGFGLVHGLGFASALGAASLPRARLVRALLGFNVGVEVGQLAVVALAWPTLRWLERRAGAWPLAVGSAAVAGLGTFWFVVRAFG